MSMTKSNPRLLRVLIKSVKRRHSPITATVIFYLATRARFHEQKGRSILDSQAAELLKDMSRRGIIEAQSSHVVATKFLRNQDFYVLYQVW